MADKKIKREMIKKDNRFVISAKDIYQTHKSALVISLLSIILISLIVILASSIEQGPDVTINNNAREMSFDLNDNSINLGFSLVNSESSNSFSESSEVPTESFETIIKENTKDYSKWGYKVKLNNQKFTAKVPISSNDPIIISSSDSLTIGDKLLSFSDLTNTGYTITIESLDEYNVEVYITRDFSDVIISSVNEINSSINKTPTSSLTLDTNNSENPTNFTLTTNNSNSTNESSSQSEPLTPSPATATNIENIEYEDTDNSNTLSLGDVLYLDPTLTTIAVPDVSIDSLLTNVTSENNFTHLDLIGDTSNPWRGFNYTTSGRTQYPPYFVDDDNSYGSFDGVDDYVNFTKTSSLNITENITLSAWVRPSPMSSADHFILTNYDQKYAIEGRGDGNKFRSVLYNGTYNYLSSTTTPIAGNWYHVVMTYNGTTESIYINGIFENSLNQIGNISTSASNVFIGSHSSGFYYWNGSIDNVLILNRSLTSSEVSALYNLSRKDTSYTDPSLVSAWRFDNPNLSNAYDSIGINNGTFSNGAQYGYDNSGLVAYYPFDVQENSANNKTYDYSGNNFDGTLTNGAAFNASCGLGYGNCYSFDGSNDKITVTSSPSFAITNDITILIWIKPFNGLTATTRPLDKNGDWTVIKDVTVSNGKLAFYNWKNAIYSPQVSVPQDTWTQIAFVGSIGDGKIHAYQNGTEVGTGTAGFTGITYSTQMLGIGARGDAGQNPFNGSIDEVMIFNTALNSSQILDIYNNQSQRFKTAGTQTLKSQNISQGYNSINLSASNYLRTKNTNLSTKLGLWNVNQTIGSGTAYKDYDLGEHWAEFNGASSYVNTTLYYSANTNLTISTWVNMKNAMNYPMILTAGNGSSFELRFYQGTRRPDFIYNSSVQATSTSTVNLNEWNLITGIYNGSAIGIYINGILSASTNIGSTSSSPFTWNIARRAYPANSDPSSYYYFNGSLDEVMIFNRSLNASEISNLYSKGRDIDYYDDSSLVSWYGFDSGNSRDKKGNNSGTDTSVTYNQSNSLANGLVSYYHFDETSWAGTTGEVKDSLGRNNGTAVSGATTTTNGIYYRGGSFDSVNDYISVPNSQSLNFSKVNSATISAWYKRIGAGESGAGRLIEKNSVFNIIADSSLQVYFYNSTGSNSNSFSGNCAVAGIWHNIIATYNGTTISSYCDGILVDSDPLIGNISSNTNAILIGGLTTIRYFNGSLDEVMIFNRSLSSQEIQELYTKGRANWNYTDTQNLTPVNAYDNLSLNTFAISKNTTNILPIFNFLSDRTYNFYSPVVSTSQTSASSQTNPIILNITDTITPLATLFSPSNNSYWNTSYPTFNASFSDSSGESSGSIIPNLDGSLVSWWRMDDLNSTGGVVDYMGRNNGTNIGGVTQTPNGSRGMAMNFDGLDDSVSLGNPDSLKLANNYTISTWFKTNISYTGYNRIISTYSIGVPRDIDLDFWSNNNLGIFDRDSGGSVNLRSGGGWNDNNWHQVIVTRNINNFSIYIDGSLKNSTIGNNNGAPAGAGWAISGEKDPPSGNYFNGSIDDVMIFNRSLSAQEIVSLYNATQLQHSSVALSDGSHSLNLYSEDTAGNVNQTGLVTFYTDTVFPQINFTNSTPTNNSYYNTNNLFVNASANDSVNNVSLFVDFDNSLVSWWRMDDLNSSDGVVDFMGRNNGTPSGGAVQVDNGKFGKGMDFYGVNSAITLGNPSSLNLQNFSASFWIKPLGKGTTGTSYLDLLDKPGIYWISIRQDGVVLFYTSVQGDNWVTSDGSKNLFDGYWHNIIFSYNGTTKTINIDGSLIQSKEVSGLIGTNTNTVYLGYGAYSYNGTMDDVMIFNRSLSTQEIQSLYANSSTKYLGVNFTSLLDGNHTIKAYTQDSAGNVNTTEQRIVITDTSTPNSRIFSPSNLSFWNNPAVNITMNSSETNSASGSIIPNIDSSLVSWWRMDDLNSTGGVVDYMGRNNATAVNVTSQVDNGKFGKAMSFNGSNQYIGTGMTNNFTQFSVSAWFYANTLSSERGIITKYVSSFQNGSWTLEVYPSGVLWDISDGAQRSCNSAVSTGIWYHVVGTYNGTNGVLYINGANKCSFSVGAIKDLAEEIRIGRILNWNSFNGSIDDVMIFNRSLSSSEILALYNATAPSYNYTFSGDGNHTVQSYVQDYAGNINSTTHIVTLDTTYPTINLTSPVNGTYYNYNNVSFNSTSSETSSALGSIVPNLDNSLVSWWRMDDANTTTVFDYLGRNNGTLYNGVVQTDAGKFGKAYSFDGSDDVITAPVTSSYYPSDKLTVSAWIYRKGSSNSQEFVNSGLQESGTLYNWRLRYWWGNLGFSYGNGTTAVSSVSSTGSLLTANAWHFVSVTFDNGNISLYIDGNLNKNSSYTSNISYSSPYVYIGRYPGSAYWFNGSLDDVMIFNRSLSAAEILSIYNATALTHSSLNLSEANHTLNVYTQDPAGNINSTGLINFGVDTTLPNITIINPTDNRYSNTRTINFTVNLSDNLAGIKNATLNIFDMSGNSWLNFNGSGSYVSIPDNDRFTSSNITISSWVNVRGSFSSYNPIFLHRQDSSNRIELGILNNAFYCTFSNGTLSNSGYYSSALSSSTGWLMWTCQWDGSMIRSYLNGVNVKNESFNGTLPNINNNLEIGSRISTSQYLNGSIDEVRIYNRSLSAYEISQIYSSGLRRNSNLPADGLVSWYDMQPGSDGNTTRLVDVSNGIYNGTITGATYATSYSSVITYASNTLTTTVGIVVVLVDGIYKWFYDIWDFAGNNYQTQNSTLTIDTVYPRLNFTTGASENLSARKEKFFTNISITELNIANITWNFNGTNYFVPVVNPYNLTNGLVSYYHLDEASWNGTTGEVVDVIGRNNGTAQNGVNTTVAGRYNQAGSFDGSNDYVNVGNIDFYQNENATFSGWFYFNQNASSKGSYNRLFDENSDVILYQHSGNSYIYTVGADYFAVRPSLNLWHHIVLTRSGDTSTAKLYIDGVNYSIILQAGATNFPIIDDFRISGSSTSFNGSIDEVMIYNRSLSSQEVQALYYSKLGVYQSENRYTLEHYNSSGIFNATLESPELTGINYTIGINQSNISAGQNYNYNLSVSDLAGNTNFTQTRTVIGNNPPTFPFVVPFPLLNDSDNLDPNLNITLTLNLSDVNNNFDTAILQYKNSSSDWSQATNITLENTTANNFYTNLTALLPLPSYEDNITYRIWANDSEIDSNTSSEFTVYSYWDCSWKGTSDFGAVAGWDETKFVGNLTINNTGDPMFGTSNCTLTFRFTHDSTAGRIFFDNSPLKPSNSYSVPARTVRNITVNATFLSEVRQENIVLTSQEITSASGTNISSTGARNTTLSIVSNQQGPYLYEGVTYHPQMLYLTPQNFSLNAYIRNLMGTDVINENNTAYDVNFNWTLPQGFTNSSGTTSLAIENITDSDLHYNNINLSFTDVSGMSPGIKGFYLNSQGHNITGDIIKDASNNTLLRESIDITFLCYNVSDGVCVSSCSYLQDPDCEESTSSTGTGGTGGGGGGGGVNEEQSSASFELLSGKVQQFILTIENKYSDPKENIKISVSGINSEYIKISPDTIARIDPRSSKNITITITAPAYFAKGKYKLTFVITGELISNDTKELLTERKLVTLNIVELPKEETDLLINESLKIIKEMNYSKMVLTEVLGIYNEMQTSYNKMDYISVKNNYEKIKEIRDSAFSSKQIIADLESKIKQAEKDGISVLETKKILYTSQSAFARGDYSLALERLSEAKLTFAIETKGEFNLLYVVKNNPVKSGASALGFALFAFAASLALRLSLYKKKLKALTEEEKLLLELMKVIQRECFTNNHMSMEEYEQAMSQYETRLSRAIEEKIETEAKVANLMKIKGKKRSLEDERNRLVALVRKIQDDYLNKGIVETRIYENMIRSYSTRLAEVEEELTFFDAQEALSQNKWSRRILKIIRLSK